MTITDYVWSKDYSYDRERIGTTIPSFNLDAGTRSQRVKNPCTLFRKISLVIWSLNSCLSLYSTNLLINSCRHLYYSFINSSHKVQAFLLSFSQKQETQDKEKLNKCYSIVLSNCQICVLRFLCSLPHSLTQSNTCSFLLFCTQNGLRYFPAQKVDNIVSVSGAGDW